MSIDAKKIEELAQIGRRAYIEGAGPESENDWEDAALAVARAVIQDLSQIVYEAHGGPHAHCTLCYHIEKYCAQFLDAPTPNDGKNGPCVFQCDGEAARFMRDLDAAKALLREVVDSQGHHTGCNRCDHANLGTSHADTCAIGRAQKFLEEHEG